MAAAANANTVRLEIIGATGLVETGRVKKQDPYVEVYVNDNVVRKSKTHSRAGTDPVWDEEIDFELPGAASEIKFVIKDKNILVSDNIIGISTLDLNRSSGTGVQTLPVFSESGEPAGQLNIRVISGGRQTQRQRGTGAGTAAAAAGAGAGAGVAGAAGRHGVTGTGTRTGTGATRDLHEGQAADVGAGLGSAATGGRTGAHGTATTGLESDMANKARIGGTATGVGAGAAGAGIGAGVAGAGAERREERREEREERREERDTAMGAVAAMGAGAGTGRGAPGFTGEMTNLSGQGGTVCDQKFFTVEEDRPIVKEVKQYVREHHPVEREMVRETKTTGRERGMGARPAELVDTNERIVETTAPSACP